MESTNRDKGNSLLSPESGGGFLAQSQVPAGGLQVASADVGKHPVLYARATLSGRAGKDASLRRALEEELAHTLWNRNAISSAERAGRAGVTPDLQIARTSLGKPFLRTCGRRRGAVSFSWTTGVLWGALAEAGLGVGMDAAEAAEFTGSYPYDRVFSERERGAWLPGPCETYPETAALVWSCKEAIVKAIGCGFHLIAPREVEIIPHRPRGERITSCGNFSDRALQRFPNLRSAKTSIVSFRESQTWVSIALVEGFVGEIDG